MDLGYEELIAEMRELLLTVANAISEGRSSEAGQTCIAAVKAIDRRARALEKSMEHAP